MSSPRLCACGCGELTPAHSGRGRTRLYIDGHRPVGAAPIAKYTRSDRPRKPEAPPKICVCGCGEYFAAHRNRKWIEGHKPVKQAPRAPRPTKLCACGCGTDITNTRGRVRYVSGHQQLQARRYAELRRDGFARLVAQWTDAGIVKPVVKLNVQVLRRAWRRVTSWAEFALCSPDVVVSPDPNVDFSHFIYGLIDPRTKLVRYVGLSTTGIKRPQQHRSAQQRDPKLYKSRWISELERCGLTFELVVLEITRENWDEVCAAEKWWIAYGRASGWPLTNLTDGGDGVKGLKKSDECRERMREISRETWKRPGYRAHMEKKLRGYSMGPAREALTRLRKDPEFEKKRNENASRAARTRNAKLIAEGRHPMQRVEVREKHREAMKEAAARRKARKSKS